MKWLSAQNTLDALVNTKSDDKKKDKNSNKKRRLQDSFNWLYSSNIIVVSYWYLYIWILTTIANDQKILLASLATSPGGMVGGLGFHPKGGI